MVGGVAFICAIEEALERARAATREASGGGEDEGDAVGADTGAKPGDDGKDEGGREAGGGASFVLGAGNCLKEPYRTEALSCNKVHFSISKWTDDKPAKPSFPETAS